MKLDMKDFWDPEVLKFIRTATNRKTEAERKQGLKDLNKYLAEKKALEKKHSKSKIRFGMNGLMPTPKDLDLTIYRG